MAEFAIRFFICNIFISFIISIFLLARRLIQNSLTSRMRYNLWFWLIGILAIPFLPVSPIRFPPVFAWFKTLGNTSSPETAIKDTVVTNLPDNTADWMNDFSLSISRNTPSAVGLLLCILWGIGMFVMLILILKSMRRFRAVKKSALPLQNPAVRQIYRNCLDDMQIKKLIPVYSAAFLKSPVIIGLFQPRIYLPIHLISDFHANDIRYMLLHELAHYKYKDTLANYVMNVVCVLYWFHPLVWHSLKEMRNDREVACDTSVLELLDEDSFGNYGNTLINFAEKVSLTPFPFFAGISGSMKQMRKRVRNIANYRPASPHKKFVSVLIYGITAFFLLGFAPVLSIPAAENNRYYFNDRNKDISYVDLRSTFGEYNGSFVLYDASENSWLIYNKEYASERIPPASTFKIYSALFSLESGIITPEHSLLRWDGSTYEYGAWNKDQTLQSAMQNSVNWYFQALDRQSDLSSIRDYVQKIGYGNRLVEGDTSSYWLNSSLKISPLEQVDLLKKLYNNRFGFTPENTDAVKDSIRLYCTGQGTLSGKTGTEIIEDHAVSGWFIGYIEKNNQTCFFATNIQKEDFASGAAATELTFSVLSDLDLWE
ncbi:MAG: BlaR1 family beta-lactam sensor/signal transducer [Eubacterium sp.]|nr:BlaR1 family beta-lactam sensor/signal transducer [Eubacterium sp.]